MVMSFKREGNDTNLLENLRRRRIKDLFSEDFPEDEAKLLCNGRLTCMVCPNRPIFDTVTMLGLHRNGKKHLHNFQIFEEKKKELEHLIAVRKHQQYLKNGTTAIKLAPSTSVDSFATARPYDSRGKKSRLRPGDRKLKLDLAGSTPSSEDSVQYPSPDNRASSSGKIHTHDNKPNLASKLANPPKSRHIHNSVWKDIYQQQLNGPVMHDNHLQKVFRTKVCEPVRLKPYCSTKPSSEHSKNSLHISLNSNTIESESSQLMQCNHTLKQSPPERLKHLENVSFKNVSDKEKKTGTSCKKDVCVSQTGGHPKKKEISELAEKYRLLQGSGWKKDWDGKWVKDEDAEFDSDEEPPDIP